MAIDARTQLLVLLGHPVGHSLSPAMHNAGFHERGRNACYLACDVAPPDVAAAVAGLRALRAAGANVTVPHKEAVLPLMDEVSPTARAAGAVNTIAVRDGRLYGDNTDVGGFLASLAEAGYDPRGRGALLFGAGGAARGVALGLLQAGAGPVWIANRTYGRAVELAKALSVAAGAGVAPGGAGAVAPLAMEAVATVAPRAGLVVNCTSVGLGAAGQSVWNDFSRFPPGTLAVDLVYNPEVTPFLGAAETAGLPTLGGLGMLVHQAALAWEVWFGEKGPVDVFYAAARRALAGDGA